LALPAEAKPGKQTSQAVKESISIAILDLYDGQPNEGMRCLKELVRNFASSAPAEVTCDIFDVRHKNEMADLDYDLYISSGGPGSPVESEGTAWENRFFGLMDGIRDYNQRTPERKKHVFLICHSFQLFCRHYGCGQVSKRKSTSFGIFPVHQAADGLREPLFAGLENPLWAVDSRDWQVTDPDETKLAAWGSRVLCHEKIRPYVDLDRAIMAIRFDGAFFGTQFHPEADAEGMLRYFQQEEKKRIVVEKHGLEKYHDMIRYLSDPEKIALTHDTLIPAFLRTGIAQPKTLKV